ncbi:hypothetical protein [Erythrobacter sp. F6033]|uniref:hypothetical protein n=1 Tax=Erythrobacter sp. F6033 TaxID=2926401 RepID=UPI001FF17F53|nr:hypothetical protein [Erythrobacter sp. F6033]MCK0127982.1 hypothetical protein [Erythrobacter sp. F6033]
MNKFQLQISVEHPVLFLSDMTAEENVPADTGAAVVTASDDCVCFWVQPYFEGEAKVTVSDQPCENGVACFTGTIRSPGKIVSISDSNGFSYLNVPVKEAETQVSIWVSEIENPEWTWVKIAIAAY